MTEALFCLSIGFVVYALVNNQRTTNFRVTGELILAVEPSKPKIFRNTAKAEKTKSATAELKKASLIVDPIITYLVKMASPLLPSSAVILQKAENIFRTESTS